MRSESGQIITRFFGKMFLIAAVVGILLLEGGAMLINNFQTLDVAEGTATEAGISYASAGGDLERAEERAQEFVQGKDVELVEVKADETTREMTVTVRKTARTFVLSKVKALDRFRTVVKTGRAPLRAG